MPRTPAAAAVAFSAGSRDETHTFGAVQPHGCLIAFDLATWQATHASSNAAAFLGLGTDQPLLGAPAQTLIDPALLHDLRNTLQGSMMSHAAERLVGIEPVHGGRRMDVAVHASGEAAVFEFTDHAGTDTTTVEPIALVKSMIGRLKRAPNLARLLQVAARQVRIVTGYDRVMVYKLMDDDTGEVVAEAVRPGLAPFLGVRYPAADLPPEARLLDTRQGLLMVVDVSRAPVAILAEVGEDALDLGLATLRSVPPSHRELLSRTGSAATLTVSLMAGERLWGLIACHHDKPRRIAASTADAVEMFGQILSLQIESREATEQQAEADRSRAAHDALIAAMATQETPFDDLSRVEPMLRTMLPCDGVGVWTDGRFTGIGQVPPASAIEPLIAWLDAAGTDEPIVTERLSREVPLAATFADRVAGLVAVRLSRAPHRYLMFFREEAVRSVVRGGDPSKAVEATARGPRSGRGNGEPWRETVRHACRPWLPAETQIVRALHLSLRDGILRRTDHLRREREAARESPSMLVAELDQRVRTMLALIRLLVRQSRQGAETVEGLTADLERRIRTVAVAHDQLTEAGWRGAPLRRLLESEVAASAGDAGPRVTLDGPAVTLGARAFQSLALVLHEMMANAGQYGALSTAAGALAIGWALDAGGNLAIEWVETGGPPVTPPTRRGFGSAIVDRTIPFELQGESRIRYAASGLEARFVVPAAQLLTDAGDLSLSPGHADAVGPMADLRGKRLLLVVDSLVLALDVQTMLGESGLDVAIAGNVADASRALQVSTFDAAILDVDLSGESSFPVADALAATKIPFVFAAGLGERLSIPERFAGTAVVAKPFDEHSLRQALSSGLVHAAASIG